jgi:transcriptional regulator with XRE-family HTH domain
VSRGLSKKVLAEKLKVSQGAITMWEDPSYEAVPNTANLIRIAKFFGTTVENLCTPDRKKAR